MSLAELVYDWIGGRDWFERDALITYLSRTTGRITTVSEVDECLRWLEERKQIERKPNYYRLCEFDPREQTLYAQLEIHLQESRFVDELGVKAESFVLQNTSTGGPRGDGRLAQPDFTLAAIQTWKFDPTATLEVFSFEVKNRAGSSIASVYETLAHGRYVHYPYLVYPYSYFDDELNQTLRTNCERIGVGLISFSINVISSTEFVVRDVKLVVPAERKSPNPFDVENFLQKRLDADKCIQLQNLARSSRS